MIRKDGKVYDRVVELLRGDGRFNIKQIAVATLRRGDMDHLVLIDGETVAEYNHREDAICWHEGYSPE